MAEGLDAALELRIVVPALAAVGLVDERTAVDGAAVERDQLHLPSESLSLIEPVLVDYDFWVRTAGSAVLAYDSSEVRVLPGAGKVSLRSRPAALPDIERIAAMPPDEIYIIVIAFRPLGPPEQPLG
jgi:hypothetical protein